MTRRVVPLTGEEIELFPRPCASCVFWELGVGSVEPRQAALMSAGARSATSADPMVRKQAWATSQVQDGHPPGRAVLVDGQVVAYALFGPSGAFARLPGLVPRPSDDALLLATVWVAPVHRGAGIGRLLVQAALKDALHQGRGAVEAYGDRRWLEGACLVPATWLLHEGFEVHREHPRIPLMRIDTRRTLRWADSLEHAWEEVLGHLPRRVPAPVAESVVEPSGNGSRTAERR